MSDWPERKGYSNHLGEKLEDGKVAFRGDVVDPRQDDFFKLVCIRE